MHEGVADKFIELTLDGYKKVVGEEFGGTVPGWFTDEPQIVVTDRESIRWTPDLFDAFRARCFHHRQRLGYSRLRRNHRAGRFAAITDDPEPEVATAGHDRTIINIKPEHIDAWLNPDSANLQELYAIFDDRQHPYYGHREAA